MYLVEEIWFDEHEDNAPLNMGYRAIGYTLDPTKYDTSIKVHGPGWMRIYHEPKYRVTKIDPTPPSGA